MFSTQKTLVAVVLSGLVVAGLAGSATAQTNNNRPTVKELPQYKGTFPLPGQTGPGYPTYPNQQNNNWRCDYRQIHDLAKDLEREAGRFHNVVDARYQRTNAYRHLHNDVEALESLAGRIHDLADRKANPGLILNELGKADRLVHHIEEVIDEMARFRDIDRDTIRTLRRRLSDVDDTVHDLARQIRN